VRRRLAEEMGFVCELAEVFRCRYELRLDEQMVEHEFNHVFIGFYEGDPVPDPAEVADWRWLTLQDLDGEVNRASESFTPWFRLIMRDYEPFLWNALRQGGAGSR
jgi:isopentenyl-diphosphate delta-isomerase